MTPAELDELEALQGDAGALHEAMLRGLLRQEWGRAPVLLPASRHAEALRVLTRWVRTAPLRDDADLAALLQARGNLRRLVEAMGSELDRILRDAIGDGGAIRLTAVEPPARGKLALLADARCAQDIDVLAWAAQEPAW